MQQLLESIRLARLRFDLQAVTSLELPPYKGSTLRGVFGVTLKDSACIQPQLDSCEPCPLRMRCAYPYLFETPNLIPQSSLLPPKSLAPQPFVLEPPLENKTFYRAGEKISFHITLIGKALDHWPYVIVAFNEAGRRGIGKGRGKFKLLSVSLDNECRTRDDSQSYGPALAKGDLLYDGATQRMKDLPADYGQVDPLSEDLEGEHLRVRFVTPTRIKERGDLIVQPAFHQLIKHLLLRASLVAAYHCGVRFDLDFKSLIEESRMVQMVRSSLQWQDWERYSNRQ